MLPQFAAGRRASNVLSLQFHSFDRSPLALPGGFSEVILTARRQLRCPGWLRLWRSSGPCVCKKVRLPTILAWEQNRSDSRLGCGGEEEPWAALLRHTGMRIGECVDLSYDCLHSISPNRWA